MEGVKDASFICGWTRQEDQGYPNRIAWHDSNATPHLFTLWGHFGGHRSLAINRGCVDQTRVSGAELGGRRAGTVPCKVRSRTWKEPLPVPSQKTHYVRVQ